MFIRVSAEWPKDRAGWKKVRRGCSSDPGWQSWWCQSDIVPACLAGDAKEQNVDAAVLKAAQICFITLGERFQSLQNRLSFWTVIFGWWNRLCIQKTAISDESARKRKKKSIRRFFSSSEIFFGRGIYYFWDKKIAKIRIFRIKKIISFCRGSVCGAFFSGIKIMGVFIQ